MAENQRIRLTKKLLKDALIELLKDKRIERISIKEICEVAEINRTTFYKYYDNEYVLLEEIENEAIANLDAKIGTNNTSLETMIKIFSYINENVIMFKVLFNNNAGPNLPNKIFSLPNIYESITADAKKKYSQEEINYLFCFILHGGYSTIKEWINKENRESVNEIANILFKIIVKCISM